MGHLHSACLPPHHRDTAVACPAAEEGERIRVEAVRVYTATDATRIQLHTTAGYAVAAQARSAVASAHPAHIKDKTAVGNTCRQYQWLTVVLLSPSVLSSLASPKKKSKPYLC